MQNFPKVSIIIPCYNDAEYIEDAVNSAVGQTYINKEIIVVDDGSDSKNKEILKKIKSKVDVLIAQENRGPSAARNRGIEKASGKYILVLDADDFFEPEFCKRALEAFSNEEDLCLVTCYARWFGLNDLDQVYKPQGGTLESFLFKNSAIGNSMFLKSDWHRVGGYDESMLYGWEDWEFFIRIHKEGTWTYVIPEVLFHYRKKKKSRTKIANKYEYDLLHYIFKKHSDLYREKFPETLGYFISRLKKEKAIRKRSQKSTVYKVGNFMMRPFKTFRNIFSKLHML